MSKTFDPMDRIVHGVSADGALIVRYDRAGKWRIEHPDGSSRAIGITEAVELATAPGGQVFAGRYGGKLFNARVNTVKAARS